MAVPTMPTVALNVLEMKIDELKETSSNRDVSQGSSSGGVTAAAAIAALQEAGNKTVGIWLTLRTEPIQRLTT